MERRDLPWDLPLDLIRYPGDIPMGRPVRGNRAHGTFHETKDERQG